MSPVEWYYARENKQMGPVSSLELKRLATAGELRPEDLVWREGMTEWSLASNVRGLFEDEREAGRFRREDRRAGCRGAGSRQPAAHPRRRAASARRHLFDVLLDKFRPHFGAHFIEATAKTFRACGSYGLLAAMALAAIFAIDHGRRDRRTRPPPAGRGRDSGAGGAAIRGRQVLRRASTNFTPPRAAAFRRPCCPTASRC